MKTTLAFLCLALMAPVAFAETALPVSYTCEVAVNSAELPNQFIQSESFSLPLVASGTHGGEAIVHNFETHEVTVWADGKWRTIRWSNNGEIIAQSVTLVETVFTVPQISFAYNPKNLTEFAYLRCRPEF